MESNLMPPKKVSLFDSKTMFSKHINFKIYELDKTVSGYNEHSHNYMQIWYVCKGVCNHWVNNKCYHMVKGDIFVLPPFVVHKTVPEDIENIKIIGCEFSANFFDSKFENFTKDQNFFDFAYLEPFLVTEDKVKPKLNLSLEAQTQVEALMNEMLKEYTEEDKYYDMFIRADLLRLLSIISREYAQRPKNEEAEEVLNKYRNSIVNAILYINDHYMEEIRLDDICKHSMMSKTNFCYIFKHLTNKTFTEYVIDIRIKNALELLQNTDKAITEICFDVGFNDVTHFCRTFKKVMGVSAKCYRSNAYNK